MLQGSSTGNKLTDAPLFPLQLLCEPKNNHFVAESSRMSTQGKDQESRESTVGGNPKWQQSSGRIRGFTNS